MTACTRRFPFLPACLAIIMALLPPMAQAARIVDLRGRVVEVPEHIDSISIDDSRDLIALSLITPNPVSLLAAWPRDIHRLGPYTYKRYLQRFPALETLPQVASSAENFDMESILAAAPDVAVLSLGSSPGEARLAQLQAAGIPVVFIDFFNDPFAHQARSLRILGQLTGHEQQAEAFLDFRQQHLDRIRRKVSQRSSSDRPQVFLEAHAGITRDCCYSPGKGSVGSYIEFVGGHNIGADVLNSTTGKLNLEYIITRDPGIYIATGGPDMQKTGGMVLGGGIDADTARASLQAMTQRRGIAQLSAVRTGNVHGLAHQLLNSPLDLVAIEALAGWIHPTLFAETDPGQTLEEINRRFLAVPYRGTGWVSLTPLQPEGVR